jgi:hypothetical protein
MYSFADTPATSDFNASAAARSLLSAHTKFLLTIYSAAANGLALYMQLIHDAAKTSSDIL